MSHKLILILTLVIASFFAAMTVYHAMIGMAGSAGLYAGLTVFDFGVYLYRLTVKEEAPHG